MECQHSIAIQRIRVMKTAGRAQHGSVQRATAAQIPRATWKRARRRKNERVVLRDRKRRRRRSRLDGFVVRDNSLSVAEAAASGNGVTTPNESPTPVDWQRVAGLNGFVSSMRTKLG